MSYSLGKGDYLCATCRVDMYVDPEDVLCKDCKPDCPSCAALRERCARLEKVARDLNALIISAQGTMTAYLIPDGIDADQAIERVIELLDGPRQREVQRAFFEAASGDKS